MAILPDSSGNIYSAEEVQYPTNTWIAQNDRIVGMDTGKLAMAQAIEIILNSERFAWQIYSSNYGGEFTGLIGQEPEYVSSSLKKRIEDALMQDNRILSVQNFVFTSIGHGSYLCTFEVSTVYGQITTEVEI